MTFEIKMKRFIDKQREREKWRKKHEKNVKHFCK